MMKLVNMYGSEPYAARLAGSTPALGTKHENKKPKTTLAQRFNESKFK